MALIKCEKCGKMISDKAQECPQCGCLVTKQEPSLICAECGNIVSKELKICPNCGCPSSMFKLYDEDYHNNNASKNIDETAQDNSVDLYYKGRDLESQGMYHDAFNCYFESAKLNNSDAIAQVGYCYIMGQGINEDCQEGIKYLLDAAKRSNSIAQNNLAWCYLNGRGVSVNEKEAFKWYKASASQGNPEGQNGLGWCYQNGIGIDKNEKEAQTWYELSASQGNENAIENLGIIKEKKITRKTLWIISIIAICFALWNIIPLISCRDIFGITIGNAKYSEIGNVIKEKYGDKSTEFLEFKKVNDEYHKSINDFDNYWSENRNRWKYKQGKDAERVIFSLQDVKAFFDKINAKTAVEDVKGLINYYEKLNYADFSKEEKYCKYYDALKHKFELVLFNNGTALLRMINTPRSEIDEIAYSRVLNGIDGTWTKSDYSIGNSFRSYYDVRFPSEELYVTGIYIYTSYDAMKLEYKHSRFEIE